MQRPDCPTVASVHPDGHRGRLTGQAHLTVRKVYGQDRLRFLRGRTGGAACSARRGLAWFHTTMAAEPATSILHHWAAGGGVRTTARLVHGPTAPGARLLRVAGRPAARFHAQRGRDVTPRTVACDDQGRCVQNSRHTVRPRRVRRLGQYRAYGMTRERAAQAREEAGDLWEHPAVAAARQRVVSVVLSHRTPEQPLTWVNDAKHRLRLGHVPAMCTDAYGG